MIRDTQFLLFSFFSFYFIFYFFTMSPHIPYQLIQSFQGLAAMVFFCHFSLRLRYIFSSCFSCLVFIVSILFAFFLLLRYHGVKRHGGKGGEGRELGYVQMEISLGYIYYLYSYIFFLTCCMERGVRLENLVPILIC
ncbi:hypothetical protein BGZ63DRAFT_175323 [Mariannaea sp. PMI_226]|nr:hypothetical protein BGZ63DRAFT_175323 [Mariannaea sp. PMI_226]